VEFVENNIKRGIWTAAAGEGAFYYTVDSPADVERKWPQFLATKPDFVKTYLLFSEEYAQRKDAPEFFGWKGLNPALLRIIVTRAHAAGLRVSTHVETAVDFHNAIAAGVDEINHTPGFRIVGDVRAHPDATFEIAESDAKEAAKRGTFVVTTLGGGGSKRKEHDSLNARNLKLLYESGVKVALGSDEYRSDTVPEALYLAGLHAIDNVALLKMWCETVHTIFPQRKAGELKEGYEASFLVLEGDPLKDFSNVTRIHLRVKKGRTL
jgi:imidazolonepropionase-like amidohydrolase